MPTSRTAPSSPFFEPSTPHVVVVTPGGSRKVDVASEVEEKKSTILGCTANLINAIVGSGIVGIPYAVQQAGFGAGVFLILLCAVLTETSLRLLVNTAKHVHCPTYETAAEAAFGVWGFRFIAVNMFVMAYGAMLSYLMIVKDSFSGMLGMEEQKRAILLVISLGIMVPLSSQRDMADLAWTSRLSVFIDTAMVGIVVYNAPFLQSLEEVGGFSNLVVDDAIHWDTLFVGLGVLSFAFVCQHSAFIIAGSLEKPTTIRWAKVTRLALCFCAILATTCGVTGYVGYLDATDGNILNNLGNGWSANMARGMLGCTMLFVYPLESFVARHVCVILFFAGRRAHEGEDSTILNRRDRRVGLTVLLYLCAVVPASIFEDLGPVLAITGAIGGSSLSYLMPGMVYLGIHGGRFLELVQNSWLGSLLEAEDGTVSPPTHAVETTPLVAGGNKTNDVEKQQDGDELPSDSFVMHLIKKLVWYVTGLPIWCSIAQTGKRHLTQHIHDMALKSPHPIRIGDVSYKRVPVSRTGKVRIDSPQSAFLQPAMRNMSQDDSGVKKPLRPILKNGGDLNSRIGQDLLNAQKQQQRPLEADPQEATPSWPNFFVAIFFILFGLLALVAGILSLHNG